MSVKTPKRLVKITLPCTPSRHNTLGFNELFTGKMRSSGECVFVNQHV